MPDTRISETTSRESSNASARPAGDAEHEQDHAAHPQLLPHVGGRESLRLEVEEVALLVVQLADDADPEAQHGEDERDEPGRAERDRSRMRERIAGQLALVGGARGDDEARERRARKRLAARPASPGAEIQTSLGLPSPGAFALIAVESHPASASTNGPVSAGTDGIRRATRRLRASICVSWKSSTVVPPTPPAARAMSGETTTGISRPSVGCTGRRTRMQAGVRE